MVELGQAAELVDEPRGASMTPTAAVAIKNIAPSPNPMLGERLPSLDGLRGLAILVVLFFHMNHLATPGPVSAALRALFRNGWVGVDIFFVLSGFLITGILLDAKGQPHYFRNFYARRVLRIVPLYYVVLAIYLVIVPWLAPEFSAAHGHTTTAPGLYWIFFSDRAQRNGSGGVLNPTWSVAVEQQFYLVWPILVFMFDRKTLCRLCPVIVAAAVTLRYVLLARHNSAEYVSSPMPCRMDALAMGTLVACLARGKSGLAAFRRWIKPAILVGLVGLAGIILGQRRLGYEHGELRCILGYTLVDLLSACLLAVILLAPPAHLISRVFTQRWLMACGKYSYGLYLLHMPLQEVLRSCFYPTHQFQDLAQLRPAAQILFYAINLAVVFPVAILSWHLIEKYPLKLGRCFPMTKRPGRTMKSASPLAEAVALSSLEACASR